MDYRRFHFLDRLKVSYAKEQLFHGEVDSQQGNIIGLSDAFWHEIQAHPVPVDLNVVRGYEKPRVSASVHVVDLALFQCEASRNDSPCSAASGSQRSSGCSNIPVTATSQVAPADAAAGNNRSVRSLENVAKPIRNPRPCLNLRLELNSAPALFPRTGWQRHTSPISWYVQFVR